MVEYHQISMYTNDSELKERMKKYAEQQEESVSEITRRLWRNELQGWDEEAGSQ